MLLGTPGASLFRNLSAIKAQLEQLKAKLEQTRTFKTD